MLFEAIFDNIQKDYEQLRERNKRLIEILELSDEEVEAIESKIINATPHEVRVVDANGNLLASFPPQILIRLKAETVRDGEINGIPISRTVFGEPEGLPPQQPGVYYIVSQLVKNAINRSDLLVPAEVLRDDKGNIIGCQSLGL